MSQKEQLLMKVADSVSEEQAAAVLLLLNSFLEAQDDAFCIAVDNAFVDNSDKGELVDFEQACKQLGIQL